MKVALVICPQVNPDKPPISLAYLYAYLTERNIDVTCFDFNIDLYFQSDNIKKNFWNPTMDIEWMDERQYDAMNLVDETVIETWLENIEQISPDILGFSLLSTNFFSTLRLAKRIKERNNRVKIIFGGPETYRIFALGKYDLLDYADALILGEGEESLHKIVQGINNGKKSSVSGVIFKDNGILLRNNKTDLINNINEIPFPNYDGFSFYKYKEKGQQLPLIFSRGCIGRCAFCFEKVYWKSFRCRSVENVILEIKEIIKKYGTHCFSLNDSLMNGNMQFLSEFCERIISENIKVEWWGMARINNRMTEELLNKMVKAGCIQIAYGIESGSQKVLNLMHKDYNVSAIDEVIINTYKAGIKPGINILLGFPGEEEDDFQQTCELVMRNGKFLSYVNISILGIEPLTEIYLNKSKMGIDFKDSTNWQTKDGKNNYRIRVERTRRLQEILNDYVGKTVIFETL